MAGVGLPSSLKSLLSRVGKYSPDQLVALRSTAGQPPVSTPMPSALDPRLIRALGSIGIASLYEHQRDAWHQATEFHDFVVVTATASGKTLCFNLPVVHAALNQANTRALYLYPTKALANDQAAALGRLTATLPVTYGVYHGETDQLERRAMRAAPPNILISNPDTIHHNQLAKHIEWGHWWGQLKFVVIDEAHAYRGVFGSHVAHVIRRLRRITAHYGANPVFISATATIGNPADHVEALTGRRPAVIDKDGSSQVARDIVLWRPSMSSELETARLMVASVRSGQSVIGFARSRIKAERIRRAIRRDFARSGDQQFEAALVSYRAGYQTQRRRQIESGLRDGSIRAVISTNALELGIDIWSLDVAVLSSYPGSTMAFRQQAGRAGRRDRPALVVMVIGENPLDEYIAEHPDWLIGAGAEDAAVDPSNEIVTKGQIGCAVHELPLGSGDRILYGEEVWSQIPALSSAASLAPLAGGLFGAGPYAARPRDVNLRSLEGNPFRLLFGTQEIGEIDAQYVTVETHPGAIYLHDGEPYRVTELDRVNRRVLLERGPENLLTRPLGERFVNVRRVHGEQTTADGRVTVKFCELHVRSRIAAYQEIDEQTRRPAGDPVSITPVTTDLNTQGIEIGSEFGGPGLHAVEHLFRALAPLAVICDPADLDGHTDLEFRSTGAAYVFDRTPGGSGLARKLFRAIDAVAIDAATRLSACGCEKGCPLCVHLGNCMYRNEQLSKPDAATLLGVSLAAPAARVDDRPSQSAEAIPPRLQVKLDCLPESLRASVVRVLGLGQPTIGARPCSKCGRVFAESSWERGYPYEPHNRVKGDGRQGQCSGAPHIRTGLMQDRLPGLSSPELETERMATERYGRLQKWRNAKAATVPGMNPEHILSSAKLRLISDHNPTTKSQLRTLGRFADEWMRAFADEVLATLRKYT